MKHTYRVHYIADDNTKTTVDDRHHEGLQTVETDAEIETLDQVLEISKFIGHENGYTSVQIVSFLKELEVVTDGD